MKECRRVSSRSPNVTEATAPLGTLLRDHGPPLWLQVHDASAFMAEGFRRLLRDHGGAASTTRG